ncbi:MAG TPA: MFS transporter [Planctomycetaceae bacterium]|nr:MFS transporter [Planctomycetaceae bacterium]
MADKSPTSLIVRLAIMMFLQFFIWGAWYVSMNGFLTQNDMAAYNATAYTMAPLAAIIAPLTMGLIADRLINSEKVLGILNLVGAGLLALAPSLVEAGEPASKLAEFTHPFVLCLLGYLVCFMPTLGLTASLSFKHLASGEKEFPVVRVLGTIGWIVGNWAMWGCRLFSGDAEGATFADNSPYIFYSASIASVVLGIYSFTLPRTEPPAKGEPISVGKILGFDAFGLFKDPAFFIFAISSFLICIPLAGYYANGYGYVESQGITLFGSTTGAMSTGQMSEIFFMLVMPLCFARLGVKNMLIIGMLAWVVRYGLWGWAFGQEGVLLTAPIFIGILLHGICYDFFFVTGMIYTDKKAPEEIRGQAQSLVVLLTQGLGLGIGAQAFGYLQAACTDGGELDFASFWYVPAGFALAVMLFFAAAFWDKSADETEDSVSPES